MALRRHRVAIRRSHVRYRFRTAARTAAAWSVRLAVITALLWGAHRGRRFWLESPYLRASAVEVDPAAPARFEARVGLKPGRHLFSFSAGDLTRRLEGEFPELADVRVRRRLDRAVEVRTTWRVPVARAAVGEEWRGVDAQGAWFPLDPARHDPASLTVLAGAEPGRPSARAAAFLAALKSVEEPWARRLLKLKTEPAGEAVLYLSDPLAVRWGAMAPDAEAVRRKSARLEAVLAREDGPLEYVNFVTEERVTARAAAPAPAGAPAGSAPGGKSDGKTRDRRQP